MTNVRRDDDPFSFNNDVTREEEEFERAFNEWSGHISPAFKAKLMSCNMALLGDTTLAENFYEATLYEAFCILSETSGQTIVGA